MTTPESYVIICTVLYYDAHFLNVTQSECILRREVAKS